MEIECGANSEKCYTRLSGIAEDVMVTLSTNLLNLPDTFISLSAQKTVKLTNHSHIKVHFDWKYVATLEEEAQHKMRSTLMLSQKEEMELHFSNGVMVGIIEPQFQ